MRIRWCILPTLIIIVLMGLTQTIVCKAVDGPDFSQKGSITIVMMNEDTNSPVPGGEVCLYFVAEMKEPELKYSYTDEFALCGLSLNDLEDDMLPKKLAEFADEKNITGVKKEIDANGTAVYDDLKLGLYLVVEMKAAEGYYKINPFLSSVPIKENDVWTYDVSSLPKMEPLSGGNQPINSPAPLPAPLPTAPSVPGQGIYIDPLIPQTGQLWWPIPVLGFSGSVCILIGLMLGKRDAKYAE